jgi:signal transduction histidine kinase
MTRPEPSTEALHDRSRLSSLKATALLDSPPEESFDRCTRLASRVLEAPVALVSLVDDHRQFFKSQVGLPEPWASHRESPLSYSFCQYLIRTRQPFIVNDARSHEWLHDNLAVRDWNIQAYLGMPLRTHDDQILGSVCALDHQPRNWTENQVAIMQDLTAAVTAEVELRLLASDSLKQLRELHQLEHERDEMVHMMVHDLRNPMNSLMAGLDLMADTMVVSQEHQQYLDWAQRGGENLLARIDEILTINKSNQEDFRLTPENVDPKTLIYQAVDQLHHLAKASGVRVSMDVPESLPELRGEPDKLKRVLVNLLANAIDHTPTGGWVEISVREEGASALLLSVADNGAGLPPDAGSWLFHKYRQSPDQESTQSSGLGLSFSKTVVEAHGGEIWHGPATDQGARFSFTLPLQPPV